MESVPVVKGDVLKAFVAMCFDERLKHVYQLVIKPVLEEHGFRCERADELHQLGLIIEQIRVCIEEADLFFCDLTFENPNVFYELAIAHTLNKPSLMISQHPGNIPFDVRHWRVTPYEDTKVGLLRLRSDLVEYLKKLYPSDGRRPYTSDNYPTLREEELGAQRTALRFGPYEVKRYAVKFLGDFGDCESFSDIEYVAKTSHNSSDLKREAFTALHKIDAQQALRTLLDDGLRNQPDYLVRERVVKLIGSYEPNDEVFYQIIDQLGDTSWGVRRAACEVLGRWGKRKAIVNLLGMQADGEQQVRFAAVEALERLRQVPPEQADLAERLDIDPDEDSTEPERPDDTIPSRKAWARRSGH